MNQLCKVCGEPAAGFHFGAFTCEGCKSFFGRTYNNVSGVSECKNGGRCEITKKNRTSCKSCRLRKCLSVGMSKSGSRYGRRSNWFKIHCLLSAQNQQNGLSSPETNNNNSTVTNNNNTNNSSNNNSHVHIGHGMGGKGSSSLPPLGSLGGHSSETDRPPTSSASRHVSGAPPSFTSLAGLSPEAREQFLTSLNRNMGNPELCEFFRANSKNTSFYPDEGAEDMSRRSPGSLESPNSEASLDDKSNTPLFTMPPGSPLDVKPNDFSPFDLITRDLMKLGYDPLRLWPAMLTAPTNLPSFNPYRLIFPNFPPTAAFPGGFPTNPPPSMVVPPNGPPNGLHSAKLLSSAAAAAAAVENLSLPLTPPNHVSRRLHHAVVPPSSSLTLTPPISSHGADDPCFTTQKFRNLPVQDSPIDLSARSIINNNNNDDDLVTHVKGEIISSDMDDDDDDMNELNSDRDMMNSDDDMKGTKSEYGDSEEEDHAIHISQNKINNNNNRRRRTSHSRSSCSPKRERVSTPLDLTRSTNHSNNSPPKIAT